MRLRIRFELCPNTIHFLKSPTTHLRTATAVRNRTLVSVHQQGVCIGVANQLFQILVAATARPAVTATKEGFMESLHGLPHRKTKELVLQTEQFHWNGASQFLNAQHPKHRICKLAPDKTGPRQLVGEVHGFIDAPLRYDPQEAFLTQRAELQIHTGFTHVSADTAVILWCQFSQRPHTRLK